MRNLLLSGVFLATIGASPANAGIILVTDFSANAAGLSSAPGDNLSTALFVSATSWTASTVVNPLGGLASGDLISLTNPLGTTIGSLITISWDGGAFSDTTTVSGASFVGDALDIVGHGALTGPGVPAGTAGVLDLSFTQAGGLGNAISGSGTFTALAAVPEPSTWAMTLIGFGFMAWGAATRRRARLLGSVIYRG